MYLPDGQSKAKYQWRRTKSAKVSYDNPVNKESIFQVVPMPQVTFVRLEQQILLT